ncbi:MAG: hypothetical protein V4706_01755 [Pseudomonadota bacterium]
MIPNLQTLEHATKALREGVASEPQWSVIAARIETAQTLANQGVLPGIRGHLTNAQEALQGIQTRARGCNGWSPTPLQYHELDAVQTFVDLHAIQVRQIRKKLARRRVALSLDWEGA